MAVDAGLTFAKWVSECLTLFLQVRRNSATLGLVVSGAGMLTIIVSVFYRPNIFIWFNPRPHVAHLNGINVLLIGFLLTVGRLLRFQHNLKWKLTPAYMIGAGLCFI